MTQLKKTLIKLFILVVLITPFISVLPAYAVAVPKKITLKNYLKYFYNRYSKHFDANGLIFQAPGYNVPDFRAPKSAREIISLNLYYKYRALKGEREARERLRTAILNAQTELNSRNYHSHSFSDAFAQLAIIKILDDVPFLLTSSEVNTIYSEILSRAETGIIAPDTSNRAALSAVYWQYILDNFARKKMIEPARKKELEKLIYQKIKNILDTDITSSGWYQEGNPKRFNPHYHMITAMAFLGYYEATGHIEFYLAAKKMTANLRLVSFQNGMVESMLGERPVGLGAQFYLGAGLLNCRFHYDDCGTYLNYALGNKFFSDLKYPNRLEYHYTVYHKKKDINFHDDISFSNLAEFVLLIPKFRNLKFDLTNQLNLITQEKISPNIYVKNEGRLIHYNNFKYELLADGEKTRIINCR